MVCIYQIWKMMTAVIYLFHLYLEIMSHKKKIALNQINKKKTIDSDNMFWYEDRCHRLKACFKRKNSMKFKRRQENCLNRIFESSLQGKQSTYHQNFVVSNMSSIRSCFLNEKIFCEENVKISPRYLLKKSIIENSWSDTPTKLIT